MADKCKKTMAGEIASFGSLARTCEKMAPSRIVAESAMAIMRVGSKRRPKAVAISPTPTHFINQIG